MITFKLLFLIQTAYCDDDVISIQNSIVVDPDREPRHILRQSNAPYTQCHAIFRPLQYN
jgi:hypothetical protein